MVELQMGFKKMTNITSDLKGKMYSSLYLIKKEAPIMIDHLSLQLIFSTIGKVE